MRGSAAAGAIDIGRLGCCSTGGPRIARCGTACGRGRPPSGFWLASCAEPPPPLPSAPPLLSVLIARCTSREPAPPAKRSVALWPAPGPRLRLGVDLPADDDEYDLSHLAKTDAVPANAPSTGSANETREGLAVDLLIELSPPSERCDAARLPFSKERSGGLNAGNSPPRFCTSFGESAAGAGAA